MKVGEVFKACSYPVWFHVGGTCHFIKDKDDALGLKAWLLGLNVKYLTADYEGTLVVEC